MCFLTGFYSLLRKMFIGRQRGHAQRGVSALQHAPQPWGPPRSLPLVKVTGGPRAGSVCAKPTWQPAPASLALCPLPSEPDSPRDSSATLARGGGRRAQAPCHRAPLLPAARRARSPRRPPPVRKRGLRLFLACRLAVDLLGYRCSRRMNMRCVPSVPGSGTLVAVDRTRWAGREGDRSGVVWGRARHSHLSLGVTGAPHPCHHVQATAEKEPSIARDSLVTRSVQFGDGGAQAAFQADRGTSRAGGGGRAQGSG